MTTKRALIKELAQRMECTDVAAKKFLNSYIELITEKLSEGEGVSIHYFGKLVPHYQTERPGRNLRTGEECKIRARTSVKFKASEILIQKLSQKEDIQVVLSGVCEKVNAQLEKAGFYNILGKDRLLRLMICL